jgi:hypothetical protein
VIDGLPKPSIFIGSSVERLDIAYTMQEHLEYTTEPTVWTQDIFKPSGYALVDLEKAARGFQFAIFIFAPDDMITMRGVRSGVVRDNIVFEFGLFVGALGLARCFFLVPRGAESLQLPTDLLGLIPLSYEPGRSDENLVAALGPAANRVRRAVQEQLKIEREQPRPSAQDQPSMTQPRRRLLTAQDYVVLWNSDRLQRARNLVLELPLGPYGYDDEELESHKALRQLFAFLETVSDAVLSADIEEAAARQVFEQPIRILWPEMYTSMAPLNHADEWWNPRLPKIAELYARWGRSEQQDKR